MTRTFRILGFSEVSLDWLLASVCTCSVNFFYVHTTQENTVNKRLVNTKLSVGLRTSKQEDSLVLCASVLFSRDRLRDTEAKLLDRTWVSSK
jgi:hypothetical protein